MLWHVEEGDDSGGVREIKSIKEQQIYLDDYPLMTDKATFIINGTERVIVSQIHRSPGVFFEHDKGKANDLTKILYSARIIPYRGSWLDFEFDSKDYVYFRIDRKKKLYITTFLRAMGMDNKDILSNFHMAITYTAKSDYWCYELDLEQFLTKRLEVDLVREDGSIFLSKGNKINKAVIRKAKGDYNFILKDEDLIGAFVFDDIIDQNKEVIIDVWRKNY